MRSGLAFPVSHGDGRVTLGFENSAVYQDAGDAFAAAQRSIVATLPGAVYRYINSGLNVLGAIIRDQIERTTSPTRGELWPAAGETRRIFDFSLAAMPSFSRACARKMPLVPPLAGSTYAIDLASSNVRLKANRLAAGRQYRCQRPPSAR
jgi:hypothetical protein